MQSMQVVDLFCGLGGFSAGAIEAGAEVILGVDHDSVPLKLWAANIPGARAKLAKLGSDGTQIDLPQASPSLHVHTSPPCTDLSLARGGKLPAADVEAGIHMIRWALDLVLERGDESWSLENVSTPKTREVLTEYATRFPGLVGWTTLDAAEFGAAQTRIRLIAAPLRLIENPNAPAAIASLTIFPISLISSSEALSCVIPLSPMTKALTAPCGVCVPTSIAKGFFSKVSKYSGKVSHSQLIPS